MTSSSPDSIDTVLRSDHAAIKRALADLRRNADPHRDGRALRAAVAPTSCGTSSPRSSTCCRPCASIWPMATRSRDASFAEHEHIESLLKKLDHDDTTDEQIGAALDRTRAGRRRAHRRAGVGRAAGVVAAQRPAELAELGRRRARRRAARPDPPARVRADNRRRSARSRAGSPDWSRRPSTRAIPTTSADQGVTAQPISACRPVPDQGVTAKDGREGGLIRA